MGGQAIELQAFAYLEPEDIQYIEALIDGLEFDAAVMVVRSKTHLDVNVCRVWVAHVHGIDLKYGQPIN